MTAPKRPGGWVDGIGWVALLYSPAPDDYVLTDANGPLDRDGIRVGWLLQCGVVDQSAIVTRWADGTEPSAPEPDAGLSALRAQPLPDGVYRSEGTYWMVRHWWDDVPAGWSRRWDADPTHEVFGVVPPSAFIEPQPKDGDQ